MCIKVAIYHCITTPTCSRVVSWLVMSQTYSFLMSHPSPSVSKPSGECLLDSSIETPPSPPRRDRCSQRLRTDRHQWRLSSAREKGRWQGTTKCLETFSWCAVHASVGKQMRHTSVGNEQGMVCIFSTACALCLYCVVNVLHIVEYGM